MDDMWKWATGAFGALLTIVLSMFSWGAKRQVARIDALERTKAGKDSTDTRFDRMFGQMEQHTQEDRVAHAALIQSLGEINGRLSNIEGKMEARRE